MGLTLDLTGSPGSRCTLKNPESTCQVKGARHSGSGAQGSLFAVCAVGKRIGTEGRCVVAGIWGKVEGARVPFQGDGHIQDLDSGFMLSVRA